MPQHSPRSSKNDGWHGTAASGCHHRDHHHHHHHHHHHPNHHLYRHRHSFGFSVSLPQPYQILLSPFNRPNIFLGENVSVCGKRKKKNKKKGKRKWKGEERSSSVRGKGEMWKGERRKKLLFRADKDHSRRDLYPACILAACILPACRALPAWQACRTNWSFFLFPALHRKQCLLDRQVGEDTRNFFFFFFFCRRSSLFFFFSFWIPTEQQLPVQ